ncbi:Rieske 2Fe-2S domain-containing protein [Frankia sp. CiP1_Cm_nod1]|uniref:Rieske 2Fe-2S domain-containing protein n=1 Tax=Frankia sp. CiP1_Cm_nod1 TaxID=2897160 RepID=UPI002023E234
MPLTAARKSSIDYIGHAGFVVRHDEFRLLIDPWFHPAFLESWFPFPDNGHLLERVAAGSYDALYVSHTHTDHFDRALLRMLPRSLPVLCAAFRSRDLLREMRGLGFSDITVLGHGESVPLRPGLQATMLLDTSHKEDSALLVELDGFRFLDLNDCHPKLTELPRDVDLLAAQFSGAMWYPNCYFYPLPVMREKVAQVRSGLLDTLMRTVAATDARAYVPCAGPPVFLDPALRVHNDREQTIFPHWADVAPSFVEAAPQVKIVDVQPGDRIDIVGGKPVTAAAPAPAPTDVAGYARRRQAQWGAHEQRPDTPVNTAELDAYFSRLIRRNRPLLADYQRDLTILSGTRRWTVMIRPVPPQPAVVAASPPALPPDAVPPGGATAGGTTASDGTAGGSAVAAGPPGSYELHVPPRVLRAIVDGEATWEEALLSMRIGLRRDPDLFDVTLMGLLRYGDTPVVTWQLRQDSSVSDETITRDGLRIQRYCPHAGEDLTDADIVDGVLECPRHHWAWDLTTGRCVRGGTWPLSVSPTE